MDPRTPLNLIDPPIDLIPQQDNEITLQRLFTVHNLIVDQLKIAKAKQIKIQHQNNLMSVIDSCLVLII